MSNNYNSYYGLLSRLLAEREKGSSSMARVRRGISPNTESYAFADVLPGQDPHNQQALLRASALLAAHPHIAQIVQPEAEENTRRSLGRSFAEFSRLLDAEATFDPNSPDSIATRLQQIVNQDLDDATLTLHRIFSLVEQKASAPAFLDWYLLFGVLIHWGNGVSESSLKVRKKLLRQYYEAAPFFELKK
ncbi:MAG: type I-E CRISPR-associated protein Cse2/CasB [Actinomycetaceae bacterium]|nr:type I-E CRISPR-associated protein Cse2/CasB [Actinomycetaceae bacterium]